MIVLFLLEVMADAFGALISPGKNSRFAVGLDPIKQEGLRLAALRLHGPAKLPY